MLDAEGLRDGPGALAGFQPAPSFLALMLGELRLAPESDALGLGSQHAAPAARQDAQTLVLGHRLSLSPNTVAMLREHRRKLLEKRMALGLAKPVADTLLFAEVNGSPRRSACKSLKLPEMSFHALRHTHASALIAAGLDVVAISRRLGLNTYGHLLKRDDRRSGN